MEEYDFTLVGKEYTDYKCPVCLALLRKALVLPCSHSTCTDCLKMWELQSGAYKCPLCKTAYDRGKVHQGKFIDRLVTNVLKVKCRQHLQNCDWIGTISDFWVHEKSCDYLPVLCDFPGCTLTVTRKDFDNHREICQYRTVQCKFCVEKPLFSGLENHLEVCDNYDVTCPQPQCGKHMTRKEMKLHISKDCPFAEICCPFEDMGCTQKVLRKDLEDHFKTSGHQDLSFILHSTLKLSEEINMLKKSNEELQNDMQAFKESSSSKLSELERKAEKIFS